MRIRSVRIISALMCIGLAFGSFPLFRRDVNAEIMPAPDLNDEAWLTAPEIKGFDHCDVKLEAGTVGMWYRFTPESTGMYRLCSVNFDKDTDPYIRVYTSNDNGHSLRFFAADDKGGDKFFGDFKLDRQLDAGKTYYIWAGRNDSSGYCYWSLDVTFKYELYSKVDGQLTGVYSEQHGYSLYANEGASIELGIDIDSNYYENIECSWFIDNEDTQSFDIYNQPGAISHERSINITEGTDYLLRVHASTPKSTAGPGYARTMLIGFHITYLPEIQPEIVNTLSRSGQEGRYAVPDLIGGSIDVNKVEYYQESSTGWSRITEEDGKLKVPAYDRFHYDLLDMVINDDYSFIPSIELLSFVMTSSNTSKISPDKTVEVILNPASPAPYNAADYTDYNPYFANCRIYSFTPSVSGRYTLRSSNIKVGDPYVALFDSNMQCIGYSDNIDGSNFAGSDPFARIMADYKAECNDLNFKLTADLEAGKTYYYGVWSAMFSLNECEQIVNSSSSTPILGHYNIRLTSNFTLPSATPTAKPTATPKPSNNPTTTPKPTAAPTPVKPGTSNTSSSTSAGLGDFIERLYNVALGRPSEAYGKNYWINKVKLEGFTGADVARGFLFSDEFLGKNMSNSDFLDTLYMTFFNRPADEHKADWMTLMDQGWTKMQVIDGFINSTEWANLCLNYGIASGSNCKPNIIIQPGAEVESFARRLYTTCLGRDADPAGLNDWANQLANMQISGSQAAHGFFFSDEFIAHGFSNEEYVNRLYRTFMGREADPAGFADWVGQLNSGVSRESVFQGFAGSAEWAGICAEYGILK